MNIITCPTGLYGTNTYMVSGDNSCECIIIDLGENFDRIKSVIEKNKLKPKYVLLTHEHFDHISSLNELRETYDVEVYAHMLCSVALPDPNLNLSAANMVSRKEVVCRQAEHLLDDEEEITLCGLTIKAIHAPGHSPGSMVYLIDDCAFTGDVIFRLSIGRTDFFGANHSEMEKSLKKLKSIIKPDMKIYPGHGESSIFSYELQYNPYLR